MTDVVEKKVTHVAPVSIANDPDSYLDVVDAVTDTGAPMVEVTVNGHSIYLNFQEADGLHDWLTDWIQTHPKA